MNGSSVLLLFRPYPERADFFAGTVLFIDRTIAVLCPAVTRRSKKPSAVFAWAHPDLPLQALPQMIVDQVIYGVRA